MDTSTRLVACARLILSIYPPPPSPPPTYGPAPYPLLRASDTSARLIPPPRDTSAPSDTSARLVACARLILSIYPPPPPPPPTYGPAPYPLLRASARLIPPPRDTSACLIPAARPIPPVRLHGYLHTSRRLRASDTIYLSSSPFPPSHVRPCTLSASPRV